MKFLCVSDQIVSLCSNHDEHATVHQFDPVTGLVESQTCLDISGVYGYIKDELDRNGRRIFLVVERVGSDLNRHYIENQLMGRPMTCRSDQDFRRIIRTLRGLESHVNH